MIDSLDGAVRAKTSRRPLAAIALATALLPCAALAEPPSPPAAAVAAEVVIDPDVRLRPLRDGFWLHLSRNAQGIESNGLLAPLAGGGVLLVDTAWNDAQTEKLLDFAASRLGGVRDAVVTHAHVDRNGGVGALRRRGVRPLSLDLAVAKAQAEGTPVPDVFLRAAAGAQSDPRGFELFYPGPGHTLDSFVVAFPATRILFGGCTVKSADSGTGYVGEAFLRDWPGSIEALRKRYAGYELVVPGHGAPGPLGPAFDRTIAVAREAAEAASQPRRGQIHADAPAKPDASLRWLLYVHGPVLEQQDAILAALAERGFEVIAERRDPHVGPDVARRLADQVRRLRAAGVPAERITLVGASRGGSLSLAAAAELQHPGLSVVVLGGCGTDSASFGPRLRGRVLSIDDRADRLGAGCGPTFSAAPGLTARREIRLPLGLDPGLLDAPRAEWLDPTAAWARGSSLPGGP